MATNFKVGKKGTKLTSNIEMGKTYQDKLTKKVGVATSLYVFLHGCERAMLETAETNMLREDRFYADSPRLRRYSTKKERTTTNPEIEYSSELILGDMYMDVYTGHEGVVTTLRFSLTSCEQGGFEFVDSKTGEVKTTFFDAPRLEHVATGTTPKAEQTGGPTQSFSL